VDTSNRRKYDAEVGDKFSEMNLSLRATRQALKSSRMFQRSQVFTRVILDMDWELL
jgi:hypothetical protein